MRILFLPTFLLLPSFISALPNQELVLRKTPAGCETQQQFDQTTTLYKSQGLCRSWKTTAVNDVMAMCNPTCHTKPGQSVVCSAGTAQSTYMYCDPKGNPWTPGKCSCDNKLIDDVADDVLKALPEIAKIGCEIMMGTLETVLQIGLAIIPGAGEIEDAGMVAAVQAAKIVMKVGKDATKFAKWLDPCGTKAAKYQQQAPKIVGTLNKVPDNKVPPYKKPKGGKGKRTPVEKRRGQLVGHSHAVVTEE
jgi:hypothetical protein